ncbi:hydroxyacyl dehydrogenase [Culex quinquefasciatus]|uniref:Hydroxyacyl dehydrogenase n=1 Tax=Culex quinquefasciatus TaxID=7176 RepID=B0X504_CULQU|nr:hydroxyacyl dehydrogenase [Culex quinquefasciatus]|eukprot:XP_001864726.1 hydroxyacyl dehydrogenase [Culex quinquefasciatus]
MLKNTGQSSPTQQNTVCLVTGGASGLGRATIEHFLRAGSKVILADLPTSAGAELANSLASDNVAFAPVDVTSEQDVSRALEQAVARFGRLDVAVNCAGIAFPMRSLNSKRTAPRL